MIDCSLAAFALLLIKSGTFEATQTVALDRLFVVFFFSFFFFFSFTFSSPSKFGEDSVVRSCRRAI